MSPRSQSEVYTNSNQYVDAGLFCLAGGVSFRNVPFQVKLVFVKSSLPS